jgi:hypothetical protein
MKYRVTDIQEPPDGSHGPQRPPWRVECLLGDTYWTTLSYHKTGDLAEKAMHRRVVTDRHEEQKADIIAAIKNHPDCVSPDGIGSLLCNNYSVPLSQELVPPHDPCLLPEYLSLILSILEDEADRVRMALNTAREMREVIFSHIR